MPANENTPPSVGVASPLYVRMMRANTLLVDITTTKQIRNGDLFFGRMKNKPELFAMIAIRHECDRLTVTLNRAALTSFSQKYWDEII